MVAYIITCKTGFYISYFTLMLIWVFSSTVDPECIPCKSTDQVLNEDGEFLKCDEQSNSSLREYLQRLYRSGFRVCGKGQVLDTRGVIGGSGFRVCGKGQVLDTRGVCKTVYSFSLPKEEEDAETRETTDRPRQPRDFRKYLQSKYRF